MTHVFTSCAVIGCQGQPPPTILPGIVSEKEAASSSVQGGHHLWWGSVGYMVWCSVKSIHVFIHSDVLSLNDYIWIKFP